MQQKENSLFKNFGILMSANVFVRVFFACTTIFLARLLSQEAYGQFTYGISIANLMAFTLTFGLPDFLVREVSQDRTKAPALFGQSCWLFIYLAFFNLLFLLVFSFYNDLKPETIWVLWIIAGGSGVAMAFSQILMALFRAFDCMNYQATTSILNALLLTVVLLPLAWLTRSVLAISWAHVGISVGILIVNFFLVKKLFNSDFRAERNSFSLLKKAVPFGLIVILPAFFDKVVSSCILIVLGESAVGGFNAAFMVFSAILMIAIPLDQIFYPILSKQSIDCPTKMMETFQDYIRITTILCLPISIVVFMYAGFISNHLFPAHYFGITTVLKPLAFSLVPVFWGFALLSLLRALGKQNKAAWLQFAVLLILLVSVYPVSVYRGLEGAAWLLTAIEWLSCLSLVVFVYLLQYKGFTFFKTLVRPFIAGGVMIALLYLMGDQPFLLVIPAAGLIYLLSLVITGTFTREELQFALGVLQGKSSVE